MRLPRVQARDHPLHGPMRDTPLKTVCLVSFACASAFGCLESEGTLGEAQNGSFQYECLDWGDPVCDGEQPTGLFDPLFDERSEQALPQRIALGSAFDVRFYEFGDLPGSPGLERPVEAAAETLLDALSPGFVARAPGTVALLARDGKGDVADRYTCNRAGVPRRGRGPTTALALSESADLFIRVFSESNGQLGGALPHTWSVDDPGIVTLEHPYSTSEDALSDDHIVARAVGPGTALVTVSVGDLQTTIEIRVDGGN